MPNSPVPNGSPILKTVLRNRERTIFEGFATAVSSINNSGKFDILPHHISFITMIKEYIVIFTHDKQRLSYKIKSGVLRVLNDNVEIYVGMQIEQENTPAK